MSRFKRILKKLALVALVLLIVFLLANAVLVWITGNRLEARLAALRAAGEPVVLTDLERPPLEPEKDAGTFLARARDDVKAFNKELYSVQTKPEYGEYRLDDADRKAIRAAFDAYPKLLPQLERAANCPDYRPSLDYTVAADGFIEMQLESVQRFRGAMNVLSTRARLQTVEGKSEDALATAITMSRLARHVQRDPLVISHLVLIACRAIALDAAHRALRTGPVSDKLRDALDAELAGADNSQAYLYALRSECAFGMTAYRSLSANTWITRAYFNADQAREIDLLAHHVELIDKPYSEAKAAEAQWENKSGSIRYSLSDMLAPALFKVRFARDRGTAQLRCLRILNALQRRNPMDVPAISDLGLPAAATVDPFNGEPLHIKKVDGGWVVYSVGMDLIDDGGQTDDHKDVGYGPPKKK